ncbi:hypothetical protein NEIPOLOT_01284 [Neisseria polysaccharea ATCC 43768]|nr:hypothetical protein NEIPOLOT_01284 [Neisseria polysaccharea ATCC 43768]
MSKPKPSRRKKCRLKRFRQHFSVLQRTGSIDSRLKYSGLTLNQYGVASPCPDFC